MSGSDARAMLGAITLTAELCGADLSERARAAMVRRLEPFGRAAVLAALDRVQAEHHGRLTLAAVIDRIEDGRPGPEEAWAVCWRDESESAWLTAEQIRAARAAAPLVRAGDPVGARMAFLEVYRRETRIARSAGRPAAWRLVPGSDPERLREAVRLGAARGLARALPPAPNGADVAA